MISFEFLLLCSLLTTAALCHDSVNYNVFPRPLILEYQQIVESETKEVHIGVDLHCTSWRFAAETNNIVRWKTIPAECEQYVKQYMLGRAYNVDLNRVSMEASSYARSVALRGDGKDAWIFDIDETLLSNLPYYSDHHFGVEVFNSYEFDEWVARATAPALDASLRLYDEILGLGFSIFLVTGRHETQREGTVHNLINVGFRNWKKIILRSGNDIGKEATIYKSEVRGKMMEEGYRIIGNFGDQWSDILGSSMSLRSFKLPNPMYYIP